MGAGGRPPHFESPEDLKNKIEEYFESGVRTRTIFAGKDKEPFNVPVPTITGLALYLGFESRQSFYDYEKRSQFSYIIKKARTFIEREYEEMLASGNVTGAIFALKNMGWTDRTQTDITTNGKDITPPSWMENEK